MKINFKSIEFSVENTISAKTQLESFIGNTCVRNRMGTGDYKIKNYSIEFV